MDKASRETIYHEKRIYAFTFSRSAAGVHGYLPENFMASLVGKSAWWSVPLTMLIGEIKDVDGPCGLSYSSSMRQGLLPSIAGI